MKLVDLIAKHQKSQKVVHALDYGSNFLLYQFCQDWLSLCKLSNFMFVVFENDQRAEDFYNDLSHSESIDAIKLFYPSSLASPYSSVVEPKENLVARLNVLNFLHNEAHAQDKVILVTSLYAAALPIPTPKFFSAMNITIEKAETKSPYLLANQLIQIGYQSKEAIVEPGDFSHRGEVFDIYSIEGEVYRINYFDDVIETISMVDPATMRTLKQDHFTKARLSLTPYYIFHQDYINQFRSKVAQPGPRFKARYEARKSIIEQASDREVFPQLAKYFPLFNEETTNLLKFIKAKKGFSIYLGNQSPSDAGRAFLENLENQYKEVSLDIESSAIISEPQQFLNQDGFDELGNIHLGLVHGKAIEDFEEIKVISSSAFLEFTSRVGSRNKVNDFFDAIKRKSDSFQTLTICYLNEKSLKEINYILDLFKMRELEFNIQFIKCALNEGFYLPDLNQLVVSDSDFFIQKKEVKKSRRSSSSNSKSDFFAEHLASIKHGDYVIHSQFGIGTFEGLQSIEQNGNVNDFVVLNYLEGDKIYVPIYKLNQIQKHSDSESTIKVDSLRTNRFSLAKTRVRKSVKALAFDLIKLQAERASRKAHAFTIDTHLYKEFELDFPFDETPDQDQAIKESLKDLSSSRPMDRLICGDVGFGKTEVAMRTAFKVVEEKKQVAVLVPTTILALQHFNTFSTRFKNFAVNIQFICRLKTKKEIAQIVSDLENGHVDIVIGTHGLLTHKNKFKDLGLIIIDEEHRFGVSHKEQLKLLKSNVHCMTLTATPIPRTLQLGLLGIKDFSLIKTPPPLKQSVKTIVMHEDKTVLKQAIDFELNRGGQLFVVHNKVYDIELYANKIRELAPNINLTIAHGQLPTSEIEKRILSFYKGTSNVLLATTIIESGIDIPNANTMIIFHADKLGLAQLHQLRGRIGRSDKKSYAYLLISKDKSLSNESEKRLKALQMYSDLGAGFSLANSDLEIRGSGDILGAEQSGHINEIGLELYLELLQEAISELKGEEVQTIPDMEIITPFKASIPDFFIAETGRRIAYYKQISNAVSNSKLVEIAEELQDIYGNLPTEVSQLITILKARNILSPLGVQSLKVGQKEISIQFNQDYLNSRPEIRERLANFFIQNSNLFSINPNYLVSYKAKSQINPTHVLDLANNIAQQIIPC